jgi:hypothetical protein
MASCQAPQERQYYQPSPNERERVSDWVDAPQIPEALEERNKFNLAKFYPLS